MRWLALDHTLQVKWISKGLPLIPPINPSRSKSFTSAISAKIPLLVSWQESSGVKQVQPESKDEHRPQFKGIEVPLITEDGSAVLGTTEVPEHLERLDRAEDAAQQDKSGGSVQSEAEGLHIAWGHARSRGLDMHCCDDDYHQALDHCLEDETCGNELAAAFVFVDIRACGCVFGSTGCCDALHCGADIDEEDEDSVGIEDGMHGEVVHQSADQVVCCS